MNWLQIKNNADKTIDEIYIYGEIGDWWEELDAKSLSDQLKASTQDTINVRINSGGGNVFTALSFYSLLKTSGKKIKASVDGICASAATFFLCAADEVTMTVGGQVMIHDPLAGVYGQSKDMRKMADILDKVGGSIAMLYKEKTGQDIADIEDKMSAETWFNAYEAQEYGFVSEILETAQIAACTTDVIAMSAKRLKNVPQPLTNHVKSNNTTTEGGEKMDLTTLKNSHADVYAQAKQEGATEVKASVDEAVKAERQRIKDIQDMALPGQEDLVTAAIDNAQSAGEFAIAAMKATKEKASDHIKNRDDETKDLNKVVDTPPADPKEAENVKNKKDVDDMVAYAKELRGE